MINIIFMDQLFIAIASSKRCPLQQLAYYRLVSSATPRQALMYLGNRLLTGDPPMYAAPARICDRYFFIKR